MMIILGSIINIIKRTYPTIKRARKSFVSIMNKIFHTTSETREGSGFSLNLDSLINHLDTRTNCMLHVLGEVGRSGKKKRPLMRTIRVKHKTRSPMSTFCTCCNTTCCSMCRQLRYISKVIVLFNTPTPPCPSPEFLLLLFPLSPPPLLPLLLLLLQAGRQAYM